MANELTIVEFPNATSFIGSVGNSAPPLPYVASQTVTIGADSVALNAATKAIFLVATAALRWNYGAPASAGAASALLPANIWIGPFGVRPGSPLIISTHAP